MVRLWHPFRVLQTDDKVSFPVEGKIFFGSTPDNALPGSHECTLRTSSLAGAKAASLRVFSKVAPECSSAFGSRLSWALSVARLEKIIPFSCDRFVYTLWHPFRVLFS